MSAPAKAPTLTKEMDALIQAWVWQMHQAGEAVERIAAEVNTRFANGREEVTPESVGNWLLREEGRRAVKITTPFAEPEAVADALRFLSAELVVAQIHLDAPNHEEVGGRSGALVALVAVADFIDRFADMANANLAKPLRAMQAALTELEKGKVHPILKPRSRGRGRPQATVGTVALVKHAVVAMEAARDEGMSRTMAANAVAKELDRRGYAIPGKSIEEAGRAIAKWRDEASEGEGSHHAEAGRLLRRYRKDRPEKGTIKPGAWKSVLALADKHTRVVGMPKKIPIK